MWNIRLSFISYLKYCKQTQKPYWMKDNALLNERQFRNSWFIFTIFACMGQKHTHKMENSLAGHFHLYSLVFEIAMWRQSKIISVCWRDADEINTQTEKEECGYLPSAYLCRTVVASLFICSNIFFYFTVFFNGNFFNGTIILNVKKQGFF